jgi:hypothetical protein
MHEKEYVGRLSAELLYTIISMVRLYLAINYLSASLDHYWWEQGEAILDVRTFNSSRSPGWLSMISLSDSRFRYRC